MYTILIVDDEMEIVGRLGDIISEAFFGRIHVTEFYFSREAYDYLQKERVDILLTDIKMPGVTGFDLAQKAREINEKCHVIFLTGYDDFDNAYMAIKTGCDDFILKINTEREIVDTIHRSIQKLKIEAGVQEPIVPDTENTIMNTIDIDVDSTDTISHIKKYIREHLSGDISLSRLSEVFYLNSSYLSRFFKRETSMNLTDYILNARIKKAKELLKQTSFPIFEIAKLVGIESPIYFSRMFKLETGKTPREFRFSNTDR